MTILALTITLVHNINGFKQKVGNFHIEILGL